MNLERLQVGLRMDDQDLEVGELVRDGKNIRFKYYTSFLDSGLNLSPIKLPFTNEVHTGDPRLFDGLFGLFSDALPDGWGRLLLDRRLVAHGEDPYSIHTLDRLAYVGQLGMGALVFSPSKQEASFAEDQIKLDALAVEMNATLKGVSSDIIEELYRLGGSSGGARPKIQVGFNKSNDHLVHGNSVLPDGYEHWIIKFPSSFDLPDVAHIEYAYYLMAKDAGIEMAPSQLFHGASGDAYFGTQRFDRRGNKRLHMHSASGLMHDDFRYSQLDYGHLMDCGFQLERHVGVYDKILRLAAFNVFAHNRDDHSKNFSFLMDNLGNWRFAPAYDLTFSSSSHGMHSTTIAGEGQSPTTKHLLELAKVFGMKNAVTLIEEVQSSLNNWEDFAKQAGVSPSSTQLISKSLTSLRS